MKSLLRTARATLVRVHDQISGFLAELAIRVRWWLKRQGRAHGLDAPLVLSLTSYPARFHTLPLTLKCLMTQTVRPDRIVLWIAHEDMAEIPQSVIALTQFGLEIKACDDLRSYKKAIPILNAHIHCYLVTADDDAYYWRSWLEELVRGTLESGPKTAVCHRAHRIRLNGHGKPARYAEWDWEIKERTAGPLVFPTGVHGVLYPPLIHHEVVSRRDLFMSLCPTGDDIWFYWTVRMNGGHFRRVGRRRRVINWKNSQETSLNRQNYHAAANDRQVGTLIKILGFPPDVRPRTIELQSKAEPTL